MSADEALRQDFTRRMMAGFSEVAKMSDLLDLISKTQPLYNHLSPSEAKILTALIEAAHNMREQLVTAKEALAPFAAFAAYVKLKHPGWDHDEFSFESKVMPKFKAWRDAHKSFTALTDEKGQP